jgi:hypothetical protein
MEWGCQFWLRLSKIDPLQHGMRRGDCSGILVLRELFEMSVFVSLCDLRREKVRYNKERNEIALTSHSVHVWNGRAHDSPRASSSRISGSERCNGIASIDFIARCICFWRPSSNRLWVSELWSMKGVRTYAFRVISSKVCWEKRRRLDSLVRRPPHLMSG